MARYGWGRKNGLFVWFWCTGVSGTVNESITYCITDDNVNITSESVADCIQARFELHCHGRCEMNGVIVQNDGSGEDNYV